MTLETRLGGIPPVHHDNRPATDTEPLVQAALQQYQEAKTLLAERERELEAAYHRASLSLAPAAAARLCTLGAAGHLLHKAKEERVPIYEYDPSAYRDTWTYALRPDGQVLHVYQHSGLDESERRQLMPFAAFLAQHAQKSAASAEHIYCQLKHIIAAQSPSEVKAHDD